MESFNDLMTLLYNTPGTSSRSSCEGQWVTLPQPPPPWWQESPQDYHSLSGSSAMSNQSFSGLSISKQQERFTSCQAMAANAVNPLREEMHYSKSVPTNRSEGTLAHYRAWASELQARYELIDSDAVRPARRIYVGGLPPGVLEGELAQFFNSLLVKIGGAAARGYPVTACNLYPGRTSEETKYAFLEFRGVEEASNCMALDGIAFRQCNLRIRRPNDFDPNTAMLLGPISPDPSMDIANLEIVKTVVVDSPHKLFVGGLPCDWNEALVKELLLLPYGQLRAFNLVMDKRTGNTKGFAFCEYVDPGTTEFVIQGLNGKPLGKKLLTVKRALTSVGGVVTSQWQPQHNRVTAFT